MIKSEVNEKSDSVCSYPCLKKHDVTGSIVLFTEPKTGVMIKTGKHILYRSTQYNVGDYSKTWAEEYFLYIPSLSVTLTNEP